MTNGDLHFPFFIIIKVMDLEKENEVLQKEVASAPSRKPTSSVDWIPRPPEKFALSGHRNPVTHVTFHPVFSVLGNPLLFFATCRTHLGKAS